MVASRDLCAPNTTKYILRDHLCHNILMNMTENLKKLGEVACLFAWGHPLGC